MSRLCIDIDNVLGQSDSVMRKLINKITSNRVHLKYNEITKFDYRQCEDSDGNKITDEEWDNVHNEFSKEENILSIKPYPNVQQQLQRLAKAGHDLHFATSRLPQARNSTINWLEKHKFPKHRLHFVKHREKHEVLHGFAVIIEDDLEQAQAFEKKGVNAYLLAHPWNVTPKKSKLLRFEKWEQIIYQLLNTL